jgi:hypothetical protein
MHAIMTSVAANVFFVLLYLGVFRLLRYGFPLIYSYNTLMVPPRAPEAGKSWFGWFLTLDEVEQSATLDAAMFVEFCNLGMRIAASIGVPLCLVLIPIYNAYGVEDTDTETDSACPGGSSLLYFMSMSSLPSGSPFLWIEAFLVWAVVLVVQALILMAQEGFLARRVRWLKAQAKPRATTLLVSNIPEDYRSDAKLKEYFEHLFPGAIERVYVAKHVDRLTELSRELERAEQLHHEALHEWNQQHDAFPGEEAFAGVGSACPGVEETDCPRVQYYVREMERLEKVISEERERVLADNSAFGSAAFVTFRSRRDSQMALDLRFETSTASFTMEYPPDPTDVRYSDLLQDPRRRQTLHVIGYVLIALLFVSFFPIIGGLSFLLNLENLRRVSSFNYIMVHLPVVQSLLEGVFATLALSLFMSFLPTILRAILTTCFSLDSETLSQYYLQQWYFWFQVVFVLLITAVGSSLWERTQAIYDHPQMVFNVLAQNLPYASRFYINYTVLQWATNTLNLTRYVNLLKFVGLRAVCDDDRARELAEPEDGDYYGIGSRSARLTLILVVGLVFCTLTPVILIPTFCFFFICRFVYTYLMVFAETRKVDLGGYFWCLQLRHVQLCMPIYICTMAGVLFHKSASQWPGVIALSSILYLVYSYRSQFDTLTWETLPFREVVDMESKRPSGATEEEKGRYEQEALFPTARRGERPSNLWLEGSLDST